MNVKLESNSNIFYDSTQQRIETFMLAQRHAERKSSKHS